MLAIYKSKAALTHLFHISAIDNLKTILDDGFIWYDVIKEGQFLSILEKVCSNCNREEIEIEKNKW